MEQLALRPVRRGPQRERTEQQEVRPVWLEPQREPREQQALGPEPQELLTEKRVA